MTAKMLFRAGTKPHLCHIQRHINYTKPLRLNWACPAEAGWGAGAKTQVLGSEKKPQTSFPRTKNLSAAGPSPTAPVKYGTEIHLLDSQQVHCQETKILVALFNLSSTLVQHLLEGKDL